MVDALLRAAGVQGRPGHAEIGGQAGEDDGSDAAGAQPGGQPGGGAVGLGEGEQAESYYQGLCRFMLACANLKDTKENKASLPEFNEDYVANLSGIVVSGSVKTSKPKDDGDDFGPRSEVRSVSGIDPQ